MPYVGFSQQFLWSTTKISGHDGNDVKIIPLASVSDMVFDYYNSSLYFRDLTGFSKIGFKQFLKDSPNFANLIKWRSSLVSVDSAAFAFKGNKGNGSIITVVLVQKENVDVISFTSQYQSDYSSLMGQDKFKKWFSSFWHHKVTLKEAEASPVNYNDPSIVVKREFLIRPNIVDVGGVAKGVIVVELTVNKEGKIVNVRPGVKGTNLMDAKLFRECIRAFLQAQFNPVIDGPELQVIRLPITFKAR